MKIIGAGLPRTGTTSLAAALETLGFGPVYHLGILMQNPQHLQESWSSIFSIYNAAVDYPACYHWDILASAYPDAKVILTILDPVEWYESAYQTIYARTKNAEPGYGVAWAVKRDLWLDELKGQLEDRDATMKLFLARNEYIQAKLKDRLLVMDAKDGWAPLCEFLGCHPPAEPFPHLNKRSEF